MKILVAIKHVAGLGPDAELADARNVDPDRLDWCINECDEHAVEAAVQLRDAAGTGEVVVVTVSDEATTEGLVISLARGADRALRVWDERLAGADPIAVAHVLSGVVDREHPDLVLCGATSSDGGHAATGGALAALAELPHVAVVSWLARESDATLLVERDLEHGWLERLRVPLPALLTLQTGLNDPPYVTLHALEDARSRPIEALDLDDLAVGALPRGHEVIRLRVPADAGRAEMLPGDPEAAAARLAAILAERVGALAPVAR
jgi:electron transfer flavoprotein beta subunit